MPCEIQIRAQLGLRRNWCLWTFDRFIEMFSSLA